MNIEYKDIHDFEQEELEKLFLSVEWGKKWGRCFDLWHKFAIFV